jgi:uncharacterized membrane protein
MDPGELWSDFGYAAMGPVPVHPADDVRIMEGVILALFVLMKQNRMSRRADERDHLHLQINLLAEKEITTMLQLQQGLMLHLGMSELAHDPEVQQLAQETAVENLASELKQKLPEE